MARPRKVKQNEERPINAAQPFPEQVKVLDALIDKPPDGSRVIEFSPKLAEHILAHKNTTNRPMKPASIRAYAADILAGHWGLTGDNIKFGSDTMLKDGQNRLAAIVRANMPMTTHVVFGIDPDLFTRLDIGKPRNPADVFAIAGFRYANQAAGTVRWLLILTSDAPTNRGAHFGNAELLKAYRERFDPLLVEEGIVAAIEVRKAVNQPVAPLAAMYYLMAQKDREKAMAFFDEWAKAAGGKRSPTTQLQDRLTELSIETNNRVHENIRNSLVIRAWNAYKAGKPLAKRDLKQKTADALPTIE